MIKVRILVFGKKQATKVKITAKFSFPLFSLDPLGYFRSGFFFDEIIEQK